VINVQDIVLHVVSQTLERNAILIGSRPTLSLLSCFQNPWEWCNVDLTYSSRLVVCYYYYNRVQWSENSRIVRVHNSPLPGWLDRNNCRGECMSCLMQWRMTHPPGADHAVDAKLHPRWFRWLRFSFFILQPLTRGWGLYCCPCLHATLAWHWPSISLGALGLWARL
jgi:hypothetical protein